MNGAHRWCEPSRHVESPERWGIAARTTKLADLPGSWGIGPREAHMVDAWACWAEEGRGHATKRVGEGLAPGDPTVSEWGNPPPKGGTAVKQGEPGELKHLSTPRNREDSRSSGERTGRSPNHAGGTGCRRCQDGVERDVGRGRQTPRARRSFGRRTLLERATGAGESPVAGPERPGVRHEREYHRTRGIWWEAGAPTPQG